jgi:pimeloyl-ACP methyl ester carboxylesterase
MIIRKLFFLIFVLLFTVSCKKQQDEVLSDVFYVRHKGADMPVYVYGNSSDNVFILLLHGGPGNNVLDFRTSVSAAELEKNYVVVYWQQRGQGSSEGKFDLKDVSIDGMVEDLRAVIKVLNHNYGGDCKIFLLGHSWGGELGTAFLVKNDYQNLVKGWIEVDGAHDIPKVNKEAVKMFLSVGNQQIAAGNSKDKWQEIVDFATKTDTLAIDIKTGRELNKYAHKVESYLLDDGVLQKPASYSAREWGIIYREDFLTGIFTVNNTYINNQTFYNEIETTSFTGKLNMIKIPSLFLWGKYDFVVPSRLGEDAYSFVTSTDKKLILFDKSGHFPMDNEPEKFVQAVSAFIERNK